MPYDPGSRIYRPDFQANDTLPQWIPMGDSGTQGAGGSFVEALKQRMSRPKAPDVEMPDATIPSQDIPIPEAPLPDFGPRAAAGAAKGVAGGAKGAGGGMSSL